MNMVKPVCITPPAAEKPNTKLAASITSGVVARLITTSASKAVMFKITTSNSSHDFCFKINEITNTPVIDPMLYKESRKCEVIALR